MKLTLSLAEATKCIREHYAGVFPKLEVEIQTSTGPELADRLKAIVDTAGGAFEAQFKIARIKKLREAVTMIPAFGHPDFYGLADSKHAIECWDRFLDYICTHAKLPAPNFSLQ